MSPKLPADIKPKQAVKVLIRMGFEPQEQRGSHLRLKHPKGPWTQIPMHSRPIPVGTLSKILRDAEVDINTFLENL